MRVFYLRRPRETPPPRRPVSGQQRSVGPALLRTPRHPRPVRFSSELERFQEGCASTFDTNLDFSRTLPERRPQESGGLCYLADARAAAITKNGSVKRAGREAATGKAALETQHVLEIAGPLLPGQIERLLNVLALRRTGRSAVGFKLAKTAEPLTVGCNVGSLAAAAAMAPEDERGNDRGLPGQDSRDSGPAPASFAKSWVSALEWDAGAQPPDASEDPQRHARFRWSLGKA
ncbi:MAG: hypothetical protein BJ554DRAFT_5905 [Olpidium bornovanus]|uniref:Uncharacterized protein n=1 Tax=Olpidium bornovanus TaxID=278681 RepID=A0A8H8DL43_9FUNG|nr:MAG: hypothetical protein BJ554DRAFT_5905 [Olpidium bornovanus]